MKAVPKYFDVCMKAVLLTVLFLLSIPHTADGREARTLISDWQIRWDLQRPAAISPAQVKHNMDWVNIDQPAVLTKPENAESVWFRVTLPENVWNDPTLLLDQIEGQNVLAFVDEKLVYESRRDYLYTMHRVFLPVQQEDMGKNLYIWIETPKDFVGVIGNLQIGEYEDLRGDFILRDLGDFVMGSTFLFIAIVMFFSCFFLPKPSRSSWLSLGMVIGSCGVILITYSPFLYTFYEEYGNIWFTLFDVALYILLPALIFYFQKIYGPGPFGLIRHWTNFQFIYSAICFIFLIINQLNDNQFYKAYYFVSSRLLGVIMILQMLFLAGMTVAYMLKRKKEAYIFSIGFSVQTAAVLGDLITFYVKKGNHHLFLWKWGVLAFVVSLIVILGQRFVRSHEKLIKYSKELELFNNELQRSEKMEIISELAASVAHEVRNPLQVTRGFMQLLEEKSRADQQEYLNLALEELDRASAIITDFLTFAKPELEQVTELNLSDELRHVTGILSPLANIGGGTISLEVPESIYILGNSSKFKQAMINLVKNSIEALDGEGTVKIWACTDKEQAVIRVRDNGIGMDMNEISRLGEPYFSNKTKGTGLGLMVTFRIIEAMKGSIHFISRKGIGTEVTIKIPASTHAKEKCPSEHKNRE
ncbi:sensor histidine kinase [Paenibacillus faecalis]|uniref:sensor histidine kinase n=1 Tax=Paenibacillus faecalis TaxID=2079532 RepID=UPI000D0F8FB0|nr:HAMP domain-containing sensor histidine kinase [Paenibacillus faecalis]